MVLAEHPPIGVDDTLGRPHVLDVADQIALGVAAQGRLARARQAEEADDLGAALDLAQMMAQIYGDFSIEMVLLVISHCQAMKKGGMHQVGVAVDDALGLARGA